MEKENAWRLLCTLLGCAGDQRRALVSTKLPTPKPLMEANL